jgi:hypothetical protein
MKTLVFGVVLIILVGLGGFFYRNVAERAGDPSQIACTADAKMCPDGTSVGRTPPSCDFTLCPFPNVEVVEKSISFLVPTGYATDENAYGADASLVGAFVKPSLSETPLHTITVRSYPIGEGEIAEEVILAHTRYQPSDMQAEDFSKFETLLIDGREFQMTVIERFEALVHSAYFLVRTNDVLMFEVVEHDVTDWMEPGLMVRELPEHAALETLLSNLEVAP